jgi:hypothetical protein
LYTCCYAGLLCVYCNNGRPMFWRVTSGQRSPNRPKALVLRTALFSGHVTLLLAMECCRWYLNDVGALNLTWESVLKCYEMLRSQ